MSLVLHLDDGTIDKSVYRHDLTHNGDVVVGKHIEGDGIGDYIQLLDNDVFSFVSGATELSYTIISWVYMVDATEFVICSKWGGATANSEWRFQTDASDKLFFNLRDDSDNIIGRKYNTALTSKQNMWVMLTMTYDGSESSSGIKLYLNEDQVDDTDDNTGSYTGAQNVARAPQILGLTGTGKYGNGKIGEIKHYIDEALAPDQIAYYYNRTKERHR